MDKNIVGIVSPNKKQTIFQAYVLETIRGKRVKKNLGYYSSQEKALQVLRDYRKNS